MGICSTHFPELTRLVGRPKIVFTPEMDRVILELREHISTEFLRRKLGVSQGTLYRRIHELDLSVRDYNSRCTG